METKPLIVAARHKYLLLLPFLIILPVAVLFSALNRKTQYVSVATVWVAPSPFLPGSATPPGWNQYLSPAQNQAIVINELMSTDDFTSAVSNRAGFGSDNLNLIRSGTNITSSATHLILISHTSKDPVEAQKVVEAITEEFRSYNLEKTNEAELTAQQFYGERLKSDQQALDAAKSDLSAYVQAHPAVIGTSGQNSSDGRYSELTTALQRAQATYDQTQSGLSSAALASASTLQGQDSTFEVRDPATVPNAPRPTSKKALLIFPMAGLLLAISLAAAIYAFLMRTDHSIRVAEDLQALPGLALLGTVPDVGYVKKRGWPKQFYRLAVTALGTVSSQ